MIKKQLYIYGFIIIFFICFFFYVKSISNDNIYDYSLKYVFVNDKIYKVENNKLVNIKQIDIYYLQSRLNVEEMKLSLQELDSIKTIINNK